MNVIELFVVIIGLFFIFFAILEFTDRNPFKKKEKVKEEPDKDYYCKGYDDNLWYVAGSMSIYENSVLKSIRVRLVLMNSTPKVEIIIEKTHVNGNPEELFEKDIEAYIPLESFYKTIIGTRYLTHKQTLEKLKELRDLALEREKAKKEL